AGADDAIHSLSYQIDKTLALAEMNGQGRMPRQEIGQRRQQNRTGNVPGSIDADQPRDRPAGSSIGILEIGQDGNAAMVVGFALGGRLDVARRALQQPGAEPLLQCLDRGSRDRSRNAAIGRCSAEAAPFHDADEKVERSEPVHSIILSRKTMLTESAI